MSRCIRERLAKGQLRNKHCHNFGHIRHCSRARKGVERWNKPNSKPPSYDGGYMVNLSSPHFSAPCAW
jgi:hypothetical protein